MALGRGKQALGKYVGNLIFGINIFEFNTRVFIWSIHNVYEPIEINTVCTWHMSHGLGASLYNQLDGCIIVFKHHSASKTSGVNQRVRKVVDVLTNIVHAIDCGHATNSLTLETLHHSNDLVP